MIRGREDAEDVYQQVLTVLWRKFDQFTLGTNFPGWALRVAELEVRDFRSRSRERHLNLSSEVLLELADVMCADAEQRTYDDRQVALEQCLERLNDSDRELVDRIYGREERIADLAAELGRIPQSISNSLRRIRQTLYECVERALSRGGSA